MARTLPCPCDAQTLARIGDATGYGIFRDSTMQRVGRGACGTSVTCLRDMANNVSCQGGDSGGCSKEVSPVTTTTILEEATRLWGSPTLAWGPAVGVSCAGVERRFAFVLHTLAEPVDDACDIASAHVTPSAGEP